MKARTEDDLRILAIACTILIVATSLAAACLRGLRDAVGEVRWAHASSGLVREQQIVHALPMIVAQTGASCVVVGSSLAMADISVDVFGRELASQGLPVTCFSVATDGASPSVQAALARRMQAVSGDARPFELAIYEFTPQLASKVLHTNAGTRSHALARQAIVFDPWRVAREAARSPSDGTAMLASDLLGNETPAVASNVASQLLFGRSSSFTIGPAAYPTLSMLVWDTARRGEGAMIDDAFPAKREAHDRLLRRNRERRSRPEHVARFVRERDLVDLDFDELQVADALVALETFKRLARHVFLVLAPRNSKWVAPSPLGRERLRGVLERLSGSSGVEVLDFSETADLSDDDFFDLTHLDELTGRPKFSRLLAQRVARELQEER